MITRPSLRRKMVLNTCAVCGGLFHGRGDTKACSEACTSQLRSISAMARPAKIRISNQANNTMEIIITPKQLCQIRMLNTRNPAPLNDKEMNLRDLPLQMPRFWEIIGRDTIKRALDSDESVTVRVDWSK